MTTAAEGRQADQPHRPTLGPAHRLLGRFHFSGVIWYRLHYLGAAWVPDWLQGAGMVLFARVFVVVLGRIRVALASNLEPVLGPAGRVERWRRAYRTLLSFAQCATERYRRMAAKAPVQFVVEGEEYWREMVSGGRGAVLVTAHIGIFEAGAHLGAEHGRRPLHVVREEEIDPRAQAFVREQMTKAGSHVVTHFAGDDMRLGIELAEALRRGELVALQADRPRAGGRVVPTTIFGRPMPLPVGPAALARAAGVPLIPTFAFYEGPRRGREVIRAPIVVARTANRDDDLRVAMAQVAREIEWAIRERPHQWFCFRKLWD